MSVQSANYAIRVCDLRNATCRAVLVALAWRAKPETPHLVYMRHADLMDDSGLRSKNGLKDALRRLEAAGEIRVAQVGGRVTGFGTMASEYELLRIPAWIAAGEPERHAWKGSVCDQKGSVCDQKGSVYAQKQSQTDPHRQDSFKDSYKDKAPAISSPSPPTPKTERSARKKLPKQAVNIDDLSLPHGAAFRAWWLRFMEHRAAPIKGRRSPMTRLAAELILEDLAQISESNAIAAIREAITSAWQKPYIEKYQTARIPVNHDAAERRRRKMLEEEREMKAAFAAAHKEAA